MKIIIIGTIAEGKTVFARALQELCKRFGIEVKVTDPDFFDDGSEFTTTPITTRLHGLSAKNVKVDVVTFQTNRYGKLHKWDENVCPEFVRHHDRSGICEAWLTGGYKEIMAITKAMTFEEFKAAIASRFGKNVIYDERGKHGWTGVESILDGKPVSNPGPHWCDAAPIPRNGRLLGNYNFNTGIAEFYPLWTRAGFVEQDVK